MSHENKCNICNTSYHTIPLKSGHICEECIKDIQTFCKHTYDINQKSKSNTTETKSI